MMKMKRIKKTLIALICVTSFSGEVLASAAGAPTGAQQGVAVHDPFKGRIRVILPEKEITISDSAISHERSTGFGLSLSFGGNSHKGNVNKFSSLDATYVRFFGNPDDFSSMTVAFTCDGRSLLQYSWAYYSAKDINLQFSSVWGTSEAVISSLILRTPWLAQFFDVYQVNRQKQAPSVISANNFSNGKNSSLGFSEKHSGLSRGEILYGVEHTSWIHQLCDPRSQVRRVLNPYYSRTKGTDPDAPMFTREAFYKKSHKTLYLDFLYDADNWIDDVEANARKELKATRALIEEYLAGLKK